MDNSDKKGVKNPRQEANLLSAITYKWLFRTFLTGYKRELEVTDLYLPLDEHASRLLGNKVSRLWKQELQRCKKLNNKSTPSLLRILARYFGCDIMFFGFFLGLLEFVVKTTQPIILANLLRYFSSDHTMERTEAFYWGTGIVAGVFFDFAISHPALQGLLHLSMKMRIACCSLIYRKILRLSKTAQGETSIGQMINLLSNDINRFDYLLFSLHYMWIAPIQTALISYILYKEVDLAAAGGILTLLLFIPIHGCYGKLTSHLTSKFAYRTDERLRLTNEIISGVKVIKMYAWEKPFSYLIDKAREKEVKVIQSNSMAVEICRSFESYIPRVCIFVTVLTYVLFGNNIDAEKIYLVMAYYNILRTTLYSLFPMSIKSAAEALVSVKRLRKFLLLEEIQYKSVIRNNQVNLEIAEGIALSFENVSVKWSEDDKHDVLKQITFNVKTGSLTAIIGQVGAGKTTLFHAILKEISYVRGDIKINGKLSYASQEPWIFASSIKQNILFGKPMNKERYEKVVEACQLKRDFQLLPYGDNTLVGDRGINLSGGQCARVNLARAVYHEADIYLFDDPLSAVDTHVGKEIFEHCISSFLKEKTVLLITHQFHYLKHVDRIIILGDSVIQAEGTLRELLNSKVDLTKQMKLESESDEILNNLEIPARESESVTLVTAAHDKQAEQAETRTLGNIRAKTYLQYFGAAQNGFLVVLVFLISVLSQFTSTGADCFITYWVNQEKHGINFTSTTENDLLRGRDLYIYIYASITIFAIFLTLFEVYVFLHMCMKISRNLHALMFNSIIHTTMAFFNANPIGRIMNRFSKDTGLVDTRVPQTIIDVKQMSLYTFAVIGIVASVNPGLLIPVAIIALTAYFFRIFYIKTSRSIKRLEGITRSLVFNHLSASVQGLTTIRALHAQDILIKEFDNHQDLHTSAWFIFFSGSRAFGIYIDFLCMVFTGVVVYTLVSISDVVMAGDAGLVISQCILLTGMVQWGVRQTAELENEMTSVERIIEYSKLPQEPTLDSKPENKPPKEWPQMGEIVFKNVSLTYDSQKTPALKNLDFTVKPNEIIGIVGRTGAGKSSIINALFRLADLEGDIYIDNIAASKIALQDLRSKISIIPQEPVLFAGSLRMNLDPFDEYSDHDLWKALEDVGLKVMLESDLGLDMRVMESGTNFSIGQRQLLCLVRAIIRNNKILVLDEATANVDPRTDELIQMAVRRKFKSCTVLIIAHRLNTIMDSNKILVMDAGQVMEFDHPYNLLQRNDNIFYNLVQQTGTQTASKLFQIAKMNYVKKTIVELYNNKKRNRHSHYYDLISYNILFYTVYIEKRYYTCIIL